MRSRIRRIAAGAALALAVTAAAPLALASEGAAAVEVCRGSAAVTGNVIVIEVTGHYVDEEGGDVRLTCYLQRWEHTAQSFTDPLAGPVAVVEGLATVPIGPYEICYEVLIHPIPGGSRYQTNC